MPRASAATAEWIARQIFHGIVRPPNQDEQQPKVDRRDHKEVHGADTGHMIAQERLPRLARPGPATLGHVLGDRRLSDLDPELQQLAMDARRTPQ